MNNYVKAEFLSDSRNEALARNIVSAFLLQLNPTLEELADVRTAVSEAVTNAIVHAYKNTIGQVNLSCTLNEEVLEITVEDFGCGIKNVDEAMEPFFTTGDNDERTGMGFAVMQAFMDEVNVVSNPGKGTRVLLKKYIMLREVH